jgi:hypothetical protein
VESKSYQLRGRQGTVNKSLYMILVACNNEAGTFEGKAVGVEIFDPDDHVDAFFSATTLLDDDPASFWETKHGIAFSVWYMDKEQIMHTKRLHYRAVHGAQHVGNIFWNAYFVTQETAFQMALDIQLYSQFHTEGEWSNGIDTIRQELGARVKAIRDAKEQPSLPGLKRAGKSAQMAGMA